MSSSGEHIKVSRARHLSSKDTPHFSESTSFTGAQLQTPEVFRGRRLPHERPLDDPLPGLGQCDGWAFRTNPREGKDESALIMTFAGSPRLVQ